MINKYLLRGSINYDEDETMRPSSNLKRNKFSSKREVKEDFSDYDSDLGA